jgi:hypothetical protein
MIAAAFLAITLFGHPQVEQRTHHVDGWTLRIDRDTFTGQASCWIGKQDIEFQRDALVFHLGREADTSDAQFRVDDGAVRSVREATLEDERRGIYRGGGPLENPSAGEVALPTPYFDGARRVYIRATSDHLPRIFNVSHLADVLSAADKAGCVNTAPFP